MGLFECCHHCPSTKRHPRCHSTCKDYIKAKEINDKRNEEARREPYIPPAKTDWLNRPVWWNKKY